MARGNIMDDTELIAERIAWLEESVRFYSSKNKGERERWVVKALLENMNIAHTMEDVILPEQDPPDVIAFGAEFEVKEILDPGRKRHKEYRQELERAKIMTDQVDLLTGTGLTSMDSSVGEIYHLCLAEIGKIQNKYPKNVRGVLDLLFYVNLKQIFRVFEELFPDVLVLASCGWRSVSFVKGPVACCFYATEDAPVWLQERVGHVQYRAFQ
jgi:hypothetical protein